MPLARRPWKPDDLARLLERERTAPAPGGLSAYDELVLDGALWNAGLPGSIEAFVQTAAGDEQAHRLHKAFLLRYPDADAPLLTLSGNPQAPFAEAGDQGLIASSRGATAEPQPQPPQQVPSAAGASSGRGASGDISNLGYG